MTTTHQIPMFARLKQCTPWNGGMLAGSDVVTLDDAAKFASKHAGTEITPADFLRAAGRGQIPMLAICPRAVTMEPCRESDKPLSVPENSTPTLPIDACKELRNTGQAKWRTIEWFEKVEAFGGVLGYFTRWELPDTEPDILTTPDDCRVMGWDVHSLADAFIDKPAPAQNTATPAPVVASSTSVFVQKQRLQESRILELLTAQGYDPLKLAQRAPGKPGPKAEIRTLALNENKLFSKSSFEKAWERLRNDGAVAGAE